MYLVEDGSINIDIEIEFVVLPKDYENEIKAFPLISRYKDFCQIKLKFLSGSKVMLILSTISQFAKSAHEAGHLLYDTCYETCFNISFENITDEIRRKLQNMALKDVQSFFGITNEQLIAESQRAFFNMIKDIAND